MLEKLLGALAVLLKRPVHLSRDTEHALNWSVTRLHSESSEEWLQEVMVECARHLLETQELPDAVIRRIIWRVSKQFYRERRWLVLELDAVKGASPSESEVETRELAARATEILRNQATDFDTLVLARLLEGESPGDIATKYGSSLSTVYRSIRQIRLLLAEMEELLRPSK